MPENSLSAFRGAIDVGAGIECDVRLAADDQAMVFHDPDLRRLCGEAGSLAALPSSVLASKRLGGTGEPIPRLAQLISLAGGRTPVLIEVKTDSRNAARLTEAVARCVGHARNCGIMSFDPAVGAWLNRHRPELRRGLVLSDRDHPLARYWKLMRARPQFLALHVGAIDRPWVARLRRRMPVYSWTVRTAAGRERAATYADAAVWEANGRP